MNTYFIRRKMMIDPEQIDMFQDEFTLETYEIGSESDAEALASAVFGTNEDYNHYEQNWDDIVYGS